MLLLSATGCKRLFTSDDARVPRVGSLRGRCLVPAHPRSPRRLSRHRLRPRQGASKSALPVPSASVPPPIVQLVPMSFASLARQADSGVVTIISRMEEVRPGGAVASWAKGSARGSSTTHGLSSRTTTSSRTPPTSMSTSPTAASSGEHRGARQAHRRRRRRVEDRNLSALPLGDSDVHRRRRLGRRDRQPVRPLAHRLRGHPFGQGAHARRREGPRSERLLQLSADRRHHQPGQLRRPALNLKGEVVGINSAIRANANNIGFAIPINMVKQLLPILLRDGKVTPERARGHRRSGQRGRGGAPQATRSQGGLDQDGRPRRGRRSGRARGRRRDPPFDGKPVADPNELRWLASIAGVGKTVTGAGAARRQGLRRAGHARAPSGASRTTTKTAASCPPLRAPVTGSVTRPAPNRTRAAHRRREGRTDAGPTSRKLGWPRCLPSVPAPDSLCSERPGPRGRPRGTRVRIVATRCGSPRGTPS